MSYQLPKRLKPEQQAVEAQIRVAFHGVTRDNGVSWSESAIVVDGDGSGRTSEQARDLDNEACWEDLVDDPAWIHEPGMGGFHFLDPIGFRFYLAPAMIRCTREIGGELVSYALMIDDEYSIEQVSLLTAPQRSAVGRFVRFMIAAHQAVGNDLYGEPWQQADRHYWRAFDPGNPI